MNKDFLKITARIFIQFLLKSLRVTNRNNIFDSSNLIFFFCVHFLKLLFGEYFIIVLILFTLLPLFYLYLSKYILHKSKCIILNLYYLFSFLYKNCKYVFSKFIYIYRLSVYNN